MANPQQSFPAAEFIKQSLLPNEKIAYSSRLHWIVFDHPIALGIFTFLFYLFIPLSLFNFPILGMSFGTLVYTVLIVMTLSKAIAAWIRYETTEFAVTNKRVVMKAGWIRRYTVEIYLSRLEAINVGQSILGRIFGFGSVMMIGTGGTRDVYSRVPNPWAFRRQIQLQAEQLNKSSSDSPI